MAVAQKKPSAAPLKDLYDIGEVPPLGHVPANMHAWAIRKERHGPPETAMQLSLIHICRSPERSMPRSRRRHARA